MRIQTILNPQEESIMKRFFQVYVDFEDEKESVPMRIDPDYIIGYRRWNTSSTMVYVRSNGDMPDALWVKEDYEKFSSRLFSFLNDFVLPSPKDSSKKKYLVKRRVENSVEESYFDHNQPETNY